MKRNKILLFATLVAMCAVSTGTAKAADVNNWAGLSTTENIEITNNITAEGTPNVVNLSSTIDQIINGNGYSIIGTDKYHSISVNNTADLTLNNLGKYSDGTAEANTFSYTDLDGSTKYVNIDASVNSFVDYFISSWKPIKLNVNDSVFANNNARLFVLNNDQTINIKNSIFYNNSSTNDATIGYGKANINIEDSIFYNNTNTNEEGGVIKNTGTLTVKNSYFINNHADDDWDGFGGAIQLSTGSKNSTIENSKFEGNTAYNDGGAIALEGGMSGVGGVYIKYIKNSEFINNKCWNDGDEYGYDGGAIATDGGFIETIDNVVFDNNKAGWHGGGLWLGMSESYDEYGNILITNSTFKNNEAGLGGGMYIEYGVTNGNKKAYITNTEFTNNTVTNVKHYTSSNFGSNSRPGGYPAGGALVVGTTSRQGLPFSLPTTLNNVTFSNNTAVPHTTKNYSAGGAMYFVGITAENPLKIVDSTFSNNSAFEGGALFVDNADTAIVAAAKDVVFSGNTAGADDADYNGGSDIYFQANTYSATLSLNAADKKKVVFNGSIASYIEDETTSTIDINKSGITYNTYDGTTETSVNAGTSGEVQFNARVGDEDNCFSSINLYGGKLSIGQNADNNASIDNPDGLLNDNNFYVKGNSILNTVNDIIGNFAPKEFIISEGVSLDYMLDVDLSNAKSDTLGITENNGTLSLSSFNIISDADTDGLKIKYSDTNVNGNVKDNYTITTSNKTYDVTAENGNDGSFIVFSVAEDEGGLAAAIAAEANQYIITNNQDENVTAWKGNSGNVIKDDIDINAKGNSIYTENNLAGLVVSEETNVILRNVKELAGFNNALTNDGGTLSIIDSNIKNNSGDADIINNSGTVNINAATKDINIGSDETTNALQSAGGTINVTGSKKVTFNGSVQGTDDAQMNISADTVFNDNVSDINITQSSGTVDLKNLSGSQYNLDKGTLNIKESGNFAPDIFKLNDGTVRISDESAFSPQSNVFSGGSLDIANNKTGSLNFNSLTLNNASNMAVDVDMNKEIMDTISAASINGDGVIKVNQFNLISETNKPKISINFAAGDIKDLVSTDVKTIEGKIFKYNVGYDSTNGQFSFAGGGGNSNGYSPSVMASPVAAQLQGYLTQLNSYDEAFRNMDMYMLLPYRVRQAMKYRNRVALLDTSDYKYNSDETIYDNSTGWLRTHTTFENVPLKNGPKVSNVAYGTYFGGESKLYDLGKGWDGIWGLYIGYNGSHQAYNGISMYQNGGTLGVLGMAYKGNFFQGLTINTGANGGEASTRYGDENFSMLMAGIASKTGYNIEFKEGRYIIQPSLLLSYSFVNSFDYNNSAGIHISSDPLHAIQVEPNVKFIANLQNGWQPYAGVGAVWSIMDKTHYMANDVSLPELSVKPYVKYGVGIRKTWGERFTGFFQTYITHGGRNGIGLQLGFRWALGGKKSNQSEKL